MSIFVIGDLHLSRGADKPMDIFPGWENYEERLCANWRRRVRENDTVVLLGDTSWAMTPEQAIPDFIWIDKLPGKKILLKGNHDYWWGSVSSMNKMLVKNGIGTVSFLHNNSFMVDTMNLCGSRGWLFETGKEHDGKIIRREAMRIEASLKSVRDQSLPTVLLLHYPPVYAGQEIPEFFELMRSYGISRCYYGHIHGAGSRNAVQGIYRGVKLRLASADHIGFEPLMIG
ncbi:MAG: metallophosphoesterase [Oscillospiraceae bacterium]|nr:metallophosphoesterase [Oscillospiraceae bacterium]